jgi:hypothetical protein
MVDAAFQQADTNRDNRLDSGEFRNFLQQNIQGGGGGGYGSSSYESSSSSSGALGGGNYGASYGSGGDLGLAGGYNESSSSFSSGGAGYGAGNSGSDLGFGAGGSAGYGASGSSGYEASSSVGYGAGGAAGYGVSGGEYSSSSQSSSVQSYATDSQGLFQDNNPQIIRRPAPGGQVTYTQNIRVRFLQPPPIPPPGVSISLFLFIILTCSLFSLSSLKKFALLSHLPHPHSLFVNVLLNFLNHHHSFFVNDHPKYQLQSLPKQLFAA